MDTSDFSIRCVFCLVVCMRGASQSCNEQRKCIAAPPKCVAVAGDIVSSLYAKVSVGMTEKCNNSYSNK